MILKYTKPITGQDEAHEPATEGQQTCVISGIDRYEFGYFKEKEVSRGRVEREMYITYHLEGDYDQVMHNATVRHGCSAFIMNNDGKTIERIR